MDLFKSWQEVKEQVLEIVEAFNENNGTNFQMSFRTQFAYLAKIEKQDVTIPNTFREIKVKKMGIPIKKIPLQEAPVIETKLGQLKYEGKILTLLFFFAEPSSEAGHQLRANRRSPRVSTVCFSLVASISLINS